MFRQINGDKPPVINIDICDWHKYKKSSNCLLQRAVDSRQRVKHIYSEQHRHEKAMKSIVHT